MNLFKHSQYLLHVKGFEKMMIISGKYMKKTESLFIQQKKVNRYQHSKKVVSEIPGLEDFAIRLVSWLFLTRRWEEKFYWEFKLQTNLQLILLIKMFFGGLTETTFGLIPPRYRLPKCQAVKLTFLAASSIFKESFFDLHHKCNQLNLFWSTLGIASSQTSIIWQRGN